MHYTMGLILQLYTAVINWNTVNIIMLRNNNNKQKIKHKWNCQLFWNVLIFARKKYYKHFTFFWSKYIDSGNTKNLIFMIMSYYIFQAWAVLITRSRWSLVGSSNFLQVMVGVPQSWKQLPQTFLHPSWFSSLSQQGYLRLHPWDLGKAPQHEYCIWHPDSSSLSQHLYLQGKLQIVLMHIKD